MSEQVTSKTVVHKPDCHYHTEVVRSDYVCTCGAEQPSSNSLIAWLREKDRYEQDEIRSADLRESRYSEALVALTTQQAEIETLRQKLTAAQQLAVRQGNEIRKLERNRDALEADLRQFVAHAGRAAEPPLSLPTGHDVWVRCGNVKTQDVRTVMQAIRDLMPPRAAVPPAPARPNLLRDESSAWEIQRQDSEGNPVVTCHTRMIGGVLCRWWGDGPAPSGVDLIDRASAPPNVSQQHIQRLNEIAHSLASQLCGIAEPNDDGMIRRESVMDLVMRWRTQWNEANQMRDAVTKAPRLSAEEEAERDWQHADSVFGATPPDEKSDPFAAAPLTGPGSRLEADLQAMRDHETTGYLEDDAMHQRAPDSHTAVRAAHSKSQQKRIAAQRAVMQDVSDDPHEAYGICGFCQTKGVKRGFQRTCCAAGTGCDKKLGLPAETVESRKSHACKYCSAIELANAIVHHPSCTRPRGAPSEGESHGR